MVASVSFYDFLFDDSLFRRPVQLVFAAVDFKSDIGRPAVSIGFKFHMLGGALKIQLHHLSLDLFGIRGAGGLDGIEQSDACIVCVGSIGPDFTIRAVKRFS
jgi:hypothetical protein